MAKLAVLARCLIDENIEGYVVQFGEREVAYFAPKFDAQDLFQVMVDLGIDQTWIAPGAAHVRKLAAGITIMFERPEDEQGKSFAHADMNGWKFSTYGDDFVSSCHGYKAGGSQAEKKLRSIIWPEFSGWQWQPGLDGSIMLAALNRLQDALGVDLSSSPGVTGRKYLAARLAELKHESWLGSRAADLADLPIKEGVADLAWKKDFGETGRDVIQALAIGRAGKLYLHCVDKNSMYLSAAAGLPLGVGQPIHYGPEAFLAGPPALNGAGLYQVAVTSPDAITSKHPWHLIYDGQFGPDPLYGSIEAGNRQKVVSTSLLKLLYDFGFGVTIEQAWIWPASKRIMDDPCCNLWNVRQQLKKESSELGTFAAEASQAAGNWIKTVATSMVGLLASSSTREPLYYRPDIWRAIIETAKSRMLYNIDKCAEEKDAFPVGVLTDALYYISPIEDVFSALGSLMSRGDALGGFKHEFTLELDAEVAEALARPGVAGMVRELNKIVEKQAVWMQK